MATNQKQSALKLPAKAKSSGSPAKVARAMEVRESTSKARQGKPLAFPARRMRP